jgi:hypothetical protein
MKNMFIKSSGTLSLTAAPLHVAAQNGYTAIQFTGLKIIAKTPHRMEMGLHDLPVLQVKARLVDGQWEASEIEVITQAKAGARAPISQSRGSAPAPAAQVAAPRVAAVPGSGNAFGMLSRAAGQVPRPSQARAAAPAPKPHGVATFNPDDESLQDIPF